MDSVGVDRDLFHQREPFRLSFIFEDSPACVTITAASHLLIDQPQPIFLHGFPKHLKTILRHF
jgi:hypothetical protein